MACAGVFFAGIASGSACTQPPTNASQNDAPSASPPSSSEGSAPLGCGIACDSQNPCAGAGLSCLPGAKGGNVCKPSSCPVCPSGKFCAYDTTTCQPTGCTSDSCGFAFTGDCDDCVKASCCQKSLACANDPACAALVTCSGTCTTSACVAACASAAPASAVSEYTAAFSCAQSSCGPQCYGTASSGTDAGTGASCTPVGSCATQGGNVQSTGPDCSGSELLATVSNHCGQPIYCRVCGSDAIPPAPGQPVPAPECVEGPVQDGATVTMLRSCSSDTATAKCVSATQSHACVQ